MKITLQDVIFIAAGAYLLWQILAGFLAWLNGNIYGM